MFFPFLLSLTVDLGNDHKVRLIPFHEQQLPSQSDERWVRKPKEKDYRQGIHSFSHAGAVDLGMNDVPVLDQGQHGTCVTFAATASLNAVLFGSDFIDQQCSLELDKALGDDLWNGAYYPSQVIDPLVKYGVVRKGLCNAQYGDPSASITVEEYQSLVDKDASEVVKEVEYEYFPTPDIAQVKAALNQGKRVMVGFLLYAYSSEAVRGFNVKVDGMQYSGGLWACKQGYSMNYCTYSNAGHEVVIVGYDDDQELLKIRNSWNESVGENGDYYMTYEFFRKMAIDNTSVW